MIDPKSSFRLVSLTLTQQRLTQAELREQGLYPAVVTLPPSLDTRTQDAVPEYFFDGEQVFVGFRVTSKPVPESITMRQCRLHLLQTGKLALVAPAIASLPSPQKEAAEIEWEYGAVVWRNSPLIAQLAPVLGWAGDPMPQGEETEEQATARAQRETQAIIDEQFRIAVTL